MVSNPSSCDYQVFSIQGIRDQTLASKAWTHQPEKHVENPLQKGCHRSPRTEYHRRKNLRRMSDWETSKDVAQEGPTSYHISSFGTPACRSYGTHASQEPWRKEVHICLC